MLSRRTILLKPMQPALSGYARLQTDHDRMLLQLHARGLEPGTPVRLYWYLSGQSAKEIVQASANAHGEVSAETEEAQPQRLQAVILISAEEAPKPLLVGLCSEQGGADLMDVKNAAMALCERLSASRRPPVRPVDAPAAEPEQPQPGVPPLPREVFLPAIDPAPYAQAAAPLPEEPEPILPPPERNAPPAGRLRPLRWPRGFESLQPYFEKALPTSLFEMPGWRFVYAAHAGGPNGLWIGMQQRDGQVCSIAYAHRGSAAPAGAKGYRPMRGTDGQLYQVLVQKL